MNTPQFVPVSIDSYTLEHFYRRFISITKAAKRIACASKQAAATLREFVPKYTRLRVTRLRKKLSKNRRRYVQRAQMFRKNF